MGVSCFEAISMYAISKLVAIIRIGISTSDICELLLSYETIL